ncbi:hypothetical protein AgCh_026556 [Apium graveolens]
MSVCVSHSWISCSVYETFVLLGRSDGGPPTFGGTRTFNGDDTRTGAISTKLFIQIVVGVTLLCLLIIFAVFCGYRISRSRNIPPATQAPLVQQPPPAQQQEGNDPENCNFNGHGVIVHVDPSFGSCVFPGRQR